MGDTVQKWFNENIFQEIRSCVSVFKDFGSLIDNAFPQALPSFFPNNEDCFVTYPLVLHLFRLLYIR